MYSANLSSQNTIDINLKATKQRSASPMPPRSLFSVPHLRATNTPYNELSPPSNHRAQSVSAEYDSVRQQLSPRSPVERPSSTKSREEVDLKAARSKLRAVSVSAVEVNEDVQDHQHDEREHNDIMNHLPRSQSVDIGASTVTAQYEAHREPFATEDTELDDVSSSRSNSVGKVAKLNTIHSQKSENQTDGANTSNVSNQSPNGSVQPTKNRVHFSNSVDDAAHFADSGHSDSQSSSASTSSTESDSESGMFPDSAPKMKTKISLDTSSDVLTPKEDPNLIGKMTTPTFRKRMEIEAKQRLQPRAKTAKGAQSCMSYFGVGAGMGPDGVPEIGAIKTPKFGPKPNDAKSRRDLLIQKQRSHHKIQDAMDLFDLDFDINDELDGLDGDDDDEDFEDYSDSHRSSSYYTDGTGTDGTRSDGSDGSLRSDNFSADSSDYDTDDDFVDAPKSQHLTPITPVNAVKAMKEAKSAPIAPTVPLREDREMTPSIEPEEDAEDIPALPPRTELKDSMNSKDSKDSKDSKRSGSISSISLPPFLQHSESEDEPLPDPSPYEKEVEFERVKQEKIEEIEREIEEDWKEADEYGMNRLASMRRKEINRDLDGMFDDLSVSMSDGHLLSPRLPPSPRPQNESDVLLNGLSPLEEVVLSESPTPPPPAPIDSVDVPVDDMKMSPDLEALMEMHSDSEDEEDADDAAAVTVNPPNDLLNAPGRRVSLEDVENQDLLQEDAEPLGDLDDDANDDEHGDDDNDSEEDEVQNTMTLSQLMHDFKLDPAKSGRLERLHEYFSESLGITFAHEMLEHSPSTITQPPGDEFKSTKLRMRLMKMAKYVTAQITMSKWTGQRVREWLELDVSTVTSYTFAQPKRIEKKVLTSTPSTQSIISPRAPTVLFESIDGGTPSNRTKVKGQRTTCIDKEIAVGQTLAYTFTVDSLPEIDRVKGQKRARLITAGVRFYDEEGEVVGTLAMSDRCNIERNDRFVCGLPQRHIRFIENGSQITVELENRREDPVVKFKHYRHGKLVNKKKSQFSMEGLVQNEKCYAKMYVISDSFISIENRLEILYFTESLFYHFLYFNQYVLRCNRYIEQYYGRGNYSIRETRKSRRDLRTKRRSSRRLKSKRKLNLTQSPHALENDARDSVSPSSRTSSQRRIGKRYRASI